MHHSPSPVIKNYKNIHQLNGKPLVDGQASANGTVWFRDNPRGTAAHQLRANVVTLAEQKKQPDFHRSLSR